MSAIPWSLLMRYNPQAGTFTTIPSRERHQDAYKGKLNAQLLQIDGVVFVSITVTGERHAISAGRLAQFLHTGVMPDREPTYVNGESSDLRWSNLRLRAVPFVNGQQPTTNARVQVVKPGVPIFAPHDSDDYARRQSARSFRE